jgi:beta-glucosidase
MTVPILRSTLSRTMTRRAAIGAGLFGIVATLLACGQSSTPDGTASTSADGPSRCGEHPWCDTSLSADERTELLLAALTQDEKVALMGGNNHPAAGHTGVGAGIARLDIPLIYYTDGPLGIRQGKATAMPAGIALAATWNTDAAQRYGALVGDEAKHKGNDVLFGPAADLLRVPLAGRGFEGYGEDPWLAARMAVHYIRGVQQQGVIADFKHYADYTQEGQIGVPPLTGLIGARVLVNVIVDERTQREIHLPAARAAVQEANVGTIMCSYPRINGTYACENPFLLRDVLRDDWGFRGYVLADYLAAHNAAASFQGGLDFEPWPPLAYRPFELNAVLAATPDSAATLDDHVRNMLRTWFAFGVFDRAAYMDDDTRIDKAAHADTAQAIEEQAITLLQNDGELLPLDTGRVKRIAVIGPAADVYQFGGGSSQVDPFSMVTPLQGIVARAGDGVAVVHDDGRIASRAAAIAADADVALVFVAKRQIEGRDQLCMSLDCTGAQDRLIEAVATANPATAVILQTGAPVLMPWRQRVRAILEAWFPGQQGGNAIARVLFGDINPSGHLPVTFPDSADDLPTAGRADQYPADLLQNVHFREGVLFGYRWYDAKNIAPAFPFGFGLSYTTFAYSDLDVSPSGASVTVRNTGARAGAAVVQLYVGMPQPSPDIIQPPHQLKAFRRVSLAPGEAARVALPLDTSSFSYWDTASGAWAVAPGCYEIAVGASSRELPVRATLPMGGAQCD